LRGRYALVEEIGRGGLTVVYKAVDLVAAEAGLEDSVVALKIIEAGRKTDPDILALMHREARRLRDLVHPNIVRIYDMDAQGRIHFMVMERLEGQSLAKILRGTPDHRLSLVQVDRLVGDIASALAFTHAEGIVHADLKPGNIFIERSGRLKLIDFNIAYPVARAPKTGEEDTVKILGRLGAVTPNYASPQRMAGAEPCPADDVFSLAVVVYTALAGQHPFGGKAPAQAAREHLLAPVPDGLAGARWNALRNALAFSDDQRIASVAEFADAFVRAGRAPSIARLFRRRA
jgi:serine/threonine protein kinase